MKKVIIALLFLPLLSVAQTSSEIIKISKGSVGDQVITGQGSQLTLGNNICLATAGTIGLDLFSFSQSSSASIYKSVFISIVPSSGTVTAGAITFEQSDDASFTAGRVYTTLMQDLNTKSLDMLSVYTIAANTPRAFAGKLWCRYFRARISTGVTGTTTGVQANTTLRTTPFTPGVINSVNKVAADFLTTVSGTVAISNTSIGLSLPTTVADVASAALTTTTNTAAITPAFGTAYSVNIPVTVVSGTNPTLDVSIQESVNAGTDWFTVYGFPRITATGIYRSPRLPLTGNRIRYVQTVAGTTPSFTRSVNRLQSSDDEPAYRQIIDRTIVLTTLNSTTATLSSGWAKNVKLTVNIGAATTAPVLQIEGSDDAGATWYSIGSPLTSIASSTVQLIVNNISAQFLRARVSTAGSTVTAGYVLLASFN